MDDPCTYCKHNEKVAAYHKEWGLELQKRLKQADEYILHQTKKLEALNSRNYSLFYRIQTLEKKLAERNKELLDAQQRIATGSPVPSQIDLELQLLRARQEIVFHEQQWVMLSIPTEAEADAAAAACGLKRRSDPCNDEETHGI